LSTVYDKYESVIGLEVHAQMKTNTKAFCRCSTNFHSSPNSNVCPVCLGYPGTLPVLNEELVDYTIRMGLAINCSIREVSIFSRKNYFYPDLTKGYQITQFDTPICYDGSLDIQLKDGSKKRIGITRIHMEEDAGKSLHDFSDNDTLIDFNRCGVPLIEIVSEPDIRSSEEAYLYLSKIRQRLVYLGINDGNLEEGSMRCDANISVRLKGSEEFGTRTEVKNLNSFKNVSDAIEAEIKRQIDIIEEGESVIYQTMTFNAKDKKTTATRSKEEAHDYRYFPEPDLVKVRVGKEWIDKIEKELPEFPEARRSRFIKDYLLTEYNADLLTRDKDYADKFESIIHFKEVRNAESNNLLANIILVHYKKIINERTINIRNFPVFDEVTAKLSDSTSSGLLSVTSNNSIFFATTLATTKMDQFKIIDVSKENLSQVSDNSEIENIVKKILNENPKEVERYKIGEKKLAGFFVGKIMQESKGKANPKIVNELLIKNLI